MSLIAYRGCKEQSQFSRDFINPNVINFYYKIEKKLHTNNNTDKLTPLKGMHSCQRFEVLRFQGFNVSRFALMSLIVFLLMWGTNSILK